MLIIDFIDMHSARQLTAKEKITNFFFTRNRLSNLFSFSFGFLIAHCLDYQCLIYTIKSIFLFWRL